MVEPNILLASGSPRRAELLTRIGIKHRVFVPDIDESIRLGETIEEYVVRLAREKADAGVRTADPGTTVIAADTAVVIHGTWLGKPENRDEAKRMLRMLSGNTHEVWTGVSIAIVGGERIDFHDISRVTFVEMDDVEIDKYVETGEPLDKAGAYGVQAMGARYVQRIEGCFFNVMGLPIAKVYAGIKKLGALKRP
ncbi:MAG: Maf family protein [bacterium]|nr:Maf family protein [bacterium]